MIEKDIIAKIGTASVEWSTFNKIVAPHSPWVFEYDPRWYRNINGYYYVITAPFDAPSLFRHTTVGPDIPSLHILCPMGLSYLAFVGRAFIDYAKVAVEGLPKAQGAGSPVR